MYERRRHSLAEPPSRPGETLVAGADARHLTAAETPAELRDKYIYEDVCTVNIQQQQKKVLNYDLN